MSWTDDRINTLKKMWQAGKSASEIAEKLGGVTRNAVIGKAHRLGLSGRPSPIKKVVKKSAPAAAPAKKSTSVAPPATRGGSAAISSAKPAAAASKPTAARVPIPAAPVHMPVKTSGNAPGKPAEIVTLAALANKTSRPDGKLVSILELSEKICRWPVGDPKEGAFGYCGAEAYPGHPYCAEHVAIAFQAPNRKETRKPAKGIKVDEAPELADLEVEVEDDEEENEALENELDEDDDVVVVDVVV